MNPVELKGRQLHCDLNVPYHGEDKLNDRLRFMARLSWDAGVIFDSLSYESTFIFV